jgi:glyoxylase-like metal-dependent hydrolase (beta-lactamase superfamily II)
MVQKGKITLRIIFWVFISLHLNVVGENYLKQCWYKQVKPINEEFAVFSYTEKLNKLEHSFEPWQQTNYIGNGIIWVNSNNFIKRDTLKKGKRQYFSQTYLNDSLLVLKDYGDKNLFDVTEDMFLDCKFKIARYSPITLINYFYLNRIPPNTENSKTYSIYEAKINSTIVKLFINKKDGLLSEISLLNDDELFGDVSTKISYTNYSVVKKFYFSKNILIQKINGQIKDEVSIYDCKFQTVFPNVITAPDSYKLKKIADQQEEVKIVKYNSNINFVEFQQNDARALIVEFNSFLLVSEAPLNWKNGDRIVREAKKIAPNKPIKYFTFSHYHPYSLGGVRSFVHLGSTIICYKDDVEYLNYISSAPHALEPDSLQIQPKKPLIEELNDSVIISDGDYELKIYHIGKISAHTNDYLIYYFPKEKLLFENDLIWIGKNEKIGKAVDRQAGVFNSIKNLNLTVSTIIQSWPINKGGIKSIIPFGDLEKSMYIQ